MTDMPKVAANATPILLGDLSIAYTIVDRLDLVLQRDPFTAKPKVEFYFRTRVGGQTVRPEALRKQVVEA